MVKATFRTPPACFIERDNECFNSRGGVISIGSSCRCNCWWLWTYNKNSRQTQIKSVPDELRQNWLNSYMYGIDRDPVAIGIASQMAESQEYKNRLFPVIGRFSNMQPLLKSADVGLMIQVVDFLSQAGPLDMRMDRGAPFCQANTAADIVNQATVDDLSLILMQFEEERKAKVIAREINKLRQKQAITQTDQLACIVKESVGRKYAHTRRDKLARPAHPATKTFQAFRIYVNNELFELQQGLNAASVMLRQGGLLALISFHSLEDRIVKRFLQGDPDLYTKRSSQYYKLLRGDRSFS
ncbi:12S rRNA N4-methylcytidine methyltransferase-like isoform X2 [Corticium candelabrum]|uniref:12S rRNA N4-methylcytidine methyltransferase-like isoform X2 n=1 Tax=Corticium candelabrum TaxID=121492 RepID=UPI002E26A999|nr:12S rRNA N4-methylcytidine methyltransferase-like isoform X2 [Corticium candelabrum]